VKKLADYIIASIDELNADTKKEEELYEYKK
jgi:hypothetical protein